MDVFFRQFWNDPRLNLSTFTDKITTGASYHMVTRKRCEYGYEDGGLSSISSTIIELHDQFLDLIQNNDFNQLLLKMNSNCLNRIFFVSNNL